MKYKIIFVENKKIAERDGDGYSWLEKQFETGGDFVGYEIVNISWNGPSACVVLKLSEGVE